MRSVVNMSKWAGYTRIETDACTMKETQSLWRQADMVTRQTWLGSILEQLPTAANHLVVKI